MSGEFNKRGQNQKATKMLSQLLGEASGKVTDCYFQNTPNRLNGFLVSKLTSRTPLSLLPPNDASQIISLGSEFINHLGNHVEVPETGRRTFTTGKRYPQSQSLIASVLRDGQCIFKKLASVMGDRA